MAGSSMFSSVFVYLYSFAVVVVAVIVARHSREEQLSGQRFAARLLLVFYLGCILALTFSPQPSPGSAIASVPVDLEITPILVPFRTISDMLRYRLASEIMINLVGNIVVFVPFGILMALVYPGLATWRRIAVAGALFSLGIELGQLGVSLALGFEYRQTEIDDVILNVTGVLLGFGLLRLVRRHRARAAVSADLPHS